MMNRFKILKFIFPLIFWLASCTGGDVAGGDHGTDTPNALSMVVKTDDGKVAPHALVSFKVRIGDVDSVLVQYTDSLGRYSLSVPAGAQILQTSIGVAKDTNLVYKFIQGAPDSLSVVSDTSLLAAPLMAGVNPQKAVPFIRYYELDWRPEYDVKSVAWDSNLVLSAIFKAKKDQVQGLSYPLFGNGISVVASGLAIGSTAQARLGWIFQKMEDYGLKLHLVEWTPDSTIYIPQLLMHKLMKDQLSGYHYRDVVYPIYVEAIDSATFKSVGLRSVEITSDASFFAWRRIEHIDATELYIMGHEYQAGFDGFSIGVGFTDYSLDNYSVAMGPYFKTGFYVTTNLAKLSPLSVPAEMIAPGKPLLVRWKGGYPTDSEVAQLIKMHAVALIVPLP